LILAERDVSDRTLGLIPEKRGSGLSAGSPYATLRIRAPTPLVELRAVPALAPECFAVPPQTAIQQTEAGVNVWRDFLLAMMLAAAFAPSVLGQTLGPAVTPAESGTQGSIPDFSGVWRHPLPPWLRAAGIGSR
jgi:hypothetical protein